MISESVVQVAFGWIMRTFFPTAKKRKNSSNVFFHPSFGRSQPLITQRHFKLDSNSCGQQSWFHSHSRDMLSQYFKWRGLVNFHRHEAQSSPQPKPTRRKNIWTIFGNFFTSLFFAQRWNLKYYTDYSLCGRDLNSQKKVDGRNTSSDQVQCFSSVLCWKE